MEILGIKIKEDYLDWTKCLDFATNFFEIENNENFEQIDYTSIYGYN